jgi:hypothetical protein
MNNLEEEKYPQINSTEIVYGHDGCGAIWHTWSTAGDNTIPQLEKLNRLFPNYYATVDSVYDSILLIVIYKAPKDMEVIRFLLTKCNIRYRNKFGDNIISLLIRKYNKYEYILTVLPVLLSYDSEQNSGLDFSEEDRLTPGVNLLNVLAEIYCLCIPKKCACGNICENCEEIYTEASIIFINLLHKFVPQLGLEDQIVSYHRSRLEHVQGEGSFFPARKLVEIINQFNRAYNGNNYLEIKID